MVQITSEILSAKSRYCCSLSLIFSMDLALMMLVAVCEATPINKLISLWAM